MDFTMNMMDNGRAIPTSQAAAVAAMGGQVAYQAHAVSVTPTVSQQTQPQPQPQQPPPPAPAQRGSLHESDGGAGLGGEGKVQELTKDDSQGAFTPPPRVSSVTSHESRVEKGTDTNDFEPLIKVEIRGGIPGLNIGGEKDKNNIVQLHFNSVNEVLHYFSQRSVPQHIDAFNLLTNPDLVRNINPDLVRNHFLYVPNPQEGVRVASNGYSSGGSNSAQTPPAQGGPATSPVVVKQGSSSSGGYSKQGDRRRESGQSSSSTLAPGSLIPRPGVDQSGASFVCWICGLDLQKSLQFEEHMVDQHSVDKPYRCDDCGVTFKRKAHLDRHRRIHLPTRPYQCAVCGKGFTRNEHVRRHSFTHSGEKPYHCPTCNKTFSRREHLTKHLLSHTKPPGPHSPPPGGHPHTPGLATTLLLQTTDQNGRLVTINQGSSGAVPTSVVTTSSSSHHGPSSSGHQGSSGGSGSSRGHNHNGEPVPRPYQCGVCGKAFIRNEHLRRHVLTHSGEKPHACTTCGKAFSRREHLTKHMRSHIKPSASGSTQSSSQASHGSIQVGVSGSAATPQATLTVAQSAAVSLPTASVVASSAAHQQPPPGVAHTVAASHGTPVAHAAHLPPGTHYLPMFGLLAEVV
ncbi:zinc finger protein 37 homolog isoform X2 [Penaeus monodon]|uniref:zinc finger protein 37 homolog isoform X2 n=1 Tax=Penaeus monodon TaxID=6687 RepID=UPI0018A7C7E3|nr:zinc finger protein 37 homolog isoform X2 [Penaeus monodon]XP_047498374.1 zinc finger protein 37 homolog isoform X2 [Penaeus chinensis]